MSVESVQEFFFEIGKNIPILTFEDTSTVSKAAASLGVTPGEIAKSLVFQVKDSYIMVIMAGDKRLDNRKFKDVFQAKAKMPDSRQVEDVTGHPVGGVCPFGLKTPISVYLDKSLQAYKRIYPAAGAPNVAVSLLVQELAELTQGTWIDLTQAEMPMA
ncbi:MAG: YbaK/EbsC family protein [Desulfitobacteriaceae bacterium]